MSLRSANIALGRLERGVAAAERRYRRLRAALEEARYSSAAYRPRKPRQGRLP